MPRLVSWRAGCRPGVGQVVLLLCSLATALVLVEVAAALVAPSSRVTTDILGRRVFEHEGVWRQLRNGPHVYVDFVPATAGHQRLLNSYDFRWHINSIGLRGPELPPVASDGALRVLVLGDSQTFGWMDEARTFCGRLQELLAARTARRVVVMNGAVPGHGTFEQLWKLERLAPVVRPDFVLVVVYVDNALLPDEGNDLWNNFVRMRPRSSAVATPVARPRSAFLADHSHAYALLSAARRGLLEATYVERIRQQRNDPANRTALEQVWNQTRALLHRMRATAASAGAADLWVVYMPGLASLELGDVSAFDELRAAGLPLISLFDALQNARAETSMRLRFKLDAHYNEYAHAVIADALAEALASEHGGPLSRH